MSESPPEKNESQKEEPSPRKSWVTPLIAMIVVLAIYVLSIGPVVGLYARGKISPANLSAVVTIYRPFDYVIDNIPFLGNLLNWYVKLWLPPPRIITRNPPPNPATNSPAPTK